MVVYNRERERAIENEKRLHEWFKSLPKDSQIRKTAKIMITMRYGMLAMKERLRKND